MSNLLLGLEKGFVNLNFFCVAVWCDLIKWKWSRFCKTISTFFIYISFLKFVVFLFKDAFSAFMLSP